MFGSGGSPDPCGEGDLVNVLEIVVGAVGVVEPVSGQHNAESEGCFSGEIDRGLLGFTVDPFPKTIFTGL